MGTKKRWCWTCILHTSLNGLRSYNTVKTRLAAIRAEHVTVGLSNPLAQLPRINFVLEGLRKLWLSLHSREASPVLAFVGEAKGFQLRFWGGSIIPHWAV